MDRLVLLWWVTGCDERSAAASVIDGFGDDGIFQTVPVRESIDGVLVWERIVHVFDLEGNPNATCVYAWSSPIEGSDKQRFFAVLHVGGITGLREAVRAAIVAEARRKQ